MSTTENNKLIAEFMGELTVPSTGIYLLPNVMQLQHNGHLDKVQLTLDEMKFNTSWDWLMPVARKLYDLLGMDEEVILLFRYAIAELDLGQAYICILNASKHHKQQLASMDNYFIDGYFNDSPDEPFEGYEMRCWDDVDEENDDNIFFYGLTYAQAIEQIGKEGADFTITNVYR